MVRSRTFISLNLEARYYPVREDWAHRASKNPTTEPAHHGSAPATKRQIDVIMFLGVQMRVDQAQAARHTEVNQQVSAGEFEQQILAASMHGKER